MTHVALIVMLKFFIKNTHGLAYVAFTNISSRLWLGDKCNLTHFVNQRNLSSFHSGL